MPTEYVCATLGVAENLLHRKGGTFPGSLLVWVRNGKQFRNCLRKRAGPTPPSKEPKPVRGATLVPQPEKRQARTRRPLLQPQGHALPTNTMKEDHFHYFSHLAPATQKEEGVEGYAKQKPTPTVQTGQRNNMPVHRGVGEEAFSSRKGHLFLMHAKL